MKKIFRISMLLAAAAFTFASCQKEVSEIDTPENGEYLYSFAISNADNSGDVETKATLASDEEGVYLKWEDGDSFGAYSTNGSANSKNRPSTVSVSGDSFTLKVASTVALDAGADVYTYFPYYNGGGDKNAAVINIEDVQTQKSTGFDAKVMPMVGEPYTTETALDKDAETAVGEIRFANLGSIIEFNIYSTTAIDEEISSVAFNATNANLAGTYTINLTTVDFSDETTIALIGDGTKASVKTTLENPVAVPTSTATAKEGTKVYMVVAPGSYQGTIVVTTTGHTYTFNVATAKQFNRSRVKPLNANLANATVGELPYEEVWEPITAAADFTEGTYVIVSSDKSKYLVNDESSKNPAGGTAHFNASGKLTDVGNDARWIATASGSGLQFVSAANTSNYLWQSTTKAQGVRVGSSSDIENSANVWTIYADSKLGGESGFIGTTGGGRYLSLWTTGDWRSYTIDSDTGLLNKNEDIKAATFYKLVDNRTALDTPVLDVEETLVAWDAIANAGSYLVTINGTEYTVNDTGIDVSDYDLTDGYYTISVVAVPSNVTLYKASAAATAEVKVGTPALATPELTKGAVTKNSIQVTWEAVAEADGYSAMIVNNSDEDDIDMQDITTTSVTFTGLSASTEYTIYVSATDSRNRYATSANAEIVVETSEDVVITKGAEWSYTFESNTFSNKSASLTYNGTSLTWTSTVDPGYTNDALSFGTNSSAAAATLTTTGYTGGVKNIIISIKGNSKKTVTAAVTVNGTSLKCGGETAVTHTGNTLTDYEFVADDLVEGNISIIFTKPDGGYQIKSIQINPAAPTVTGISVEGYTPSIKESSDTYSFDGKVYAVYSNNSKVEIASSEYSVRGSVDLSTPATYTLTFSATIDGVEYTGTATITVTEDTGDNTPYELIFTSDTQPKNSSYAGSYTATIGSNTWTIAGFNNNNNGWSGQIKAGSKTSATTASIATDFAVPEAISTISVTYVAVTTTNVTSAKLIIASDKDFTTDKVEKTITVTANTTVEYTIDSPAKNKYYKLEYSLAKGSGNGFMALNKVVYDN